MTEKNKEYQGKNFELSVDLVERFEETFKKLKDQGKYKGQGDLAEDLLKIGLDSLENEPRLVFKQLIYPGHCKKCGKTVEAGEWAWWGGHGSGLIICSDCEGQKFGTKTEARKALKNAQLDYSRDALKKEIAVLVGTYGKYTAYEHLDTLYIAAFKHHNKLPNLEAALNVLNDFIKNNPSKLEELKPIAEKLLEAIKEDATTDKEVITATAEIRDFLTHPLKKKKPIPEADHEAISA